MNRPRLSRYVFFPCLWGFVLLGALTGCNTVVSVVPIGEGPAQLNPQELDGEWYHPEGTLTVSVIDGQNGIVEAASIVKDSRIGGRLRLESIRVQITKAGDWTFCNIPQQKPEEASDKPGYLWGRIKIEPKRILIWFPDPKKFAALVKEGVLPGKVDEKGNVQLDSLTKEHLRIITSEERGTLFLWEGPLVLFRRPPPE